MTPPRWVRDAYPEHWLAGRAAAVRQAGTDAEQTTADAEAQCSANLMYRPKAAAWWAGYALRMAEVDAAARVHGADHAR